jgi:hypothetical protein
MSVTVCHEIPMTYRLVVAVAVLLVTGSLRAADKADPGSAAFFENEIRPLLIEHCHRCHGDGKIKGGLRLTSRAKVLEGGDTGPAAVPGKQADSLLVKALHYRDDLKMPPKGKLPDAAIAKLTRWVEIGLPWPDATVQPGAAGTKFVITDEQRRFWSFQPVKPVQPPDVKDAAWVRSPIDRFVLAKLEAAGLKPAAPADKRTLIRRVTFDLTGLPPTPDEIDAFIKDESPDAYAKVIDRLLASSAYGERWGRHWLDLARYADYRDMRGLGGDSDIGDAWRYRDWVINAFNRDLPYDQFIVHQIAGDRLPPRAPDEINADGLVATGLLSLGEWGTGDADKEKMVTDIVNDQIDVVTRSFLALTVSCARCHDHKFDPIPTADYYGLAGIFFSTRIVPAPGDKTAGTPMLKTPLIGPAEKARRDQHVTRLKALSDRLKQTSERHAAEFAKSLLPQTADYLTAAWEYRNLPAQGKPAITALAAERKLHAFALRQWVEALASGEYRTMTTVTRDIGGRAGTFGFRGPADCPNVVVNPTDTPLSLGTPTIPAKSLTMHPGPKGPVAAVWTSPVAATVRVTGRVADADPNCGDGIGWRIDVRSQQGRRPLASGEIGNGGKQAFDQGKTAEQLKSVMVKPGDRLELYVLPRGDYTCDTTAVEWEIVADDKQTWNLTADVISGGAANPHADRLGHADVWMFVDATTAAPGSPVALPQALTSAKDAASARRAAEEFAKTFDRVDESSPFRVRRPEDESALPAAAHDEISALRRERDELAKNPPGPIPTALAAVEGGVPGGMFPGIQDVPIHVRGSYTRLGERVPRHFPVILNGGKPTPAFDGSGRLELAKWIASPDNPLTARVMVNRVWQWHFGEGFVRTPSNFGKLGTPPSHPELLDWLAGEFVRGGWSLKQLHRQILMSATYRQGGTAEPGVLKKDPDNKLFGRFAPRRLDAEEVRDAMLSASGQLDRKPGGPAFADLATPRRTVYLRAVRSDRSNFRALFDAADPEVPTEQRTVSTVAPQALFLMNHPFVTARAKAFAGRLLAENYSDEKDRIARAYRLLYGRDPTDDEVRVGLAFLGRFADSAIPPSAWAEYAQVLLCGNEFVYVD